MQQNNLLSDTEWQALLWLWEHRQEIEDRYSQQDIIFDYPQYGGMPEPLKAILSSGLVDWVQEQCQRSFPNEQLNFLRAAARHQL